ncbi:MAG: two-component regulator propeller domain-containing protein [Ignavibacterium sp.]|nr:two-component regulator propeller domain-containing protein [Ignavibacterium sp.]
MKMKICKLLLSVLLCVSFCRDVFAQEMKFSSFTAMNGLSNNFINCLIQDHTGFIWFGTDDGLNRFDGYEVKVYRNNPADRFSISENIIWAMAEDHAGNLWIGTKTGGLNKYNPETDKFENWTIDSNDAEEISITCLYVDSKNLIWIGTYKNGVYRFNPSENKFEHWQNIPGNPKSLSENYITSIIEDKKFNIWIATYKGLNKFIPDQPDNPFKRFTDHINTSVWHLTESDFYDNTIWIGTLNGLIKFNTEDEIFLQIPLPQNFDLQYGYSVSAIVEGAAYGEKILWVGTYGGIIRINLTNDYSERITYNNEGKRELLSNQIHDLLIDRSGVIWIATDNAVNFYCPKRSKFNNLISAEHFLKIVSQLSENNIRAIAQTKDKSIWFGTDVGLIGVQTSNSKSSIIKSAELSALNVWCLYNSNNDKLWIGTYGQGLKELNLNTNRIKSWKVNNPNFNISAFGYVKTVLEDNDGMIWLGFWGAGLSRLNPQTSKVDHWRNEQNNSSSLSYNDVWVTFKDKFGRIWIGTNGGGLDLYQGEDKKNFYNWSADEGSKQNLSSNNIFTIYESVEGNKKKDHSILWIGTANGLNKFEVTNDSGSRNGSELNVKIKYYTVEDGLHDNSVESILEDKNGNLWIGTSSAVSFFDIRKEQFINYTTADGLSGSSFNSGAAIKLSDEIILLGCTAGLNIFNPNRITKSDYYPPVIITDFEILNQPVENNTSPEIVVNELNNESVDLSYYQNDLSFQFASLDYNAPDENKYAYFMEGFDRDWIYSGKRRFVTYTNLDPGEYVFKVKATNSDGVWSNQVAEIFITINPPFWKTWWAYSIYTIVFLGTMTFIRSTEIKRREKKEEDRLRREREEARLREAELKAKNIEQEKELENQKIRNRIAQDLHDEIGSNLSSISLMSELIQIDEKINQEVSEKIKRIHKVAKGSTQSIRDIVWLTNPSSDSLKELIAKMKEVADNTLGKFNLKFDYPQEVVEINLLPETKRNIFFIYREALNNIIKHADAKSVEIKFHIESNSILLSMKDDGKGFNTELISSGNGLKNIKSRAKEINAQLKIESNQGIGSLLELITNITHLRD